MNETQAKLLKRGVIVLPEVLEHAVYELFVEALVIERPTDEVRVYCKGNGGDSRTAMAIADLIDQHGNVTGVLLGEAMSSHVVIFSACQKRFVSPSGALGVHGASKYIDMPIDARTASLIAVEYARANRLTAVRLAHISDQPLSYWLEMIEHAGCGGVDLIAADTMVARGMAKHLSQLPPLTSVTNS